MGASQNFLTGFLQCKVQVTDNSVDKLLRCSFCAMLLVKIWSQFTAAELAPKDDQLRHSGVLTDRMAEHGGMR